MSWLSMIQKRIVRLCVNPLKPLGITLVEAVDGIEALNILKQGDHFFDAMLIDIEMPRMDGYTLAAEIKKYNKYKNLTSYCRNVTSRKSGSYARSGIGYD